eukprot:3428_1
MATYGGAKKNTSPVTQQVVVQQPTANIKYVDQYGNPVAPPIQTQPQQVVVVQQPQPNIRYVDQNGNPVAAPQPVQVQPQPIIKYVDQNGNPVAAPQPVQQAQVQVQPMRAVAQQQQVVTNGGSVWRVTLIVLWSIALTGSIPQLVMSLVLYGYDHSYPNIIAITLSMLLPGIVSIIGGSISIYGINIYNYTLTVISAIASGISLFFGLVLFTVDGGYWWFLIAYIPPFILYSCLFAFDIVFAKHISYVKKNGHPDPNTCCNCGDCGDCGNGCDCFGPSTHQHGICQQPGVALQVGVAAQAKDREININ